MLDQEILTGIIGFLFDNCEYDGNDVIQANNVTIVSKTKDLPFQDNTFDTIISTECFEHDPEYRESFSKIYKMLKPDGLFCLRVLQPEDLSMEQEEHRLPILMEQLAN